MTIPKIILAALLVILFVCRTVLAQSAPQIAQGIQIGALGSNHVLIWSRCDRPATMMLQYADNEFFDHATLLHGSKAEPSSDFTTRVQLRHLPPGRDIYLKVWYQDANSKLTSEVIDGRFHSLAKHEAIRFVWGADTAGQGWGINQAFGGMKIYQSMLAVKPQFFIQNGDSIYSDSPITATQTAENGQIWTNVVTPEVSKVAESLTEFRGRYQYNLLDKNRRLFNQQVPQIWQWDDHEVLNNWSSAKDLSQDSRYSVKDLSVLLARASQAFHEYAPLPTPNQSPHIYQKIAYGSLLDVFVLDMRSYRGANSENLQSKPSAETAFLGKQQIKWLKRQLKHSKALWKVISADMPLGLNNSDGVNAQGKPIWEAVANGDNGPALGRELEIADLLSFIKHQQISHVVWLTGDVHYAAAHYYDPEQAQSNDFAPFWEFVAGPLNAGSFGPSSIDGTFGPQVVFNKTPPPGQSNLSPLAGLQFFGEVNIAADSHTFTVDLKDINGVSVFSKTLLP